MTSQAGPPAQAGTTRGLSRVAARPRAMPAREAWGYGLWLFVGIVFAIPEAWAGFGSPPWPSLSITVAHLETLWPGTRVVIVAVIVLLVFQAVGYPFRHAGEGTSSTGQRTAVRTERGRLTRQAGDVPVISTVGYFLAALAITAGGSLLAANASSDPYVLGYVIYSLFWIFLVGVPNALAYFCARDFAFPTLFRTVADLESRWRLAAVAAVFALVILALHLVFFPWPNIPA